MQLSADTAKRSSSMDIDGRSPYMYIYRYICVYVYIYIYTSVLPSISIDGDRLAASTLSCICRSFVLSCHLDRFVALSFSCINVKLAMDRRRGTELTGQLALEQQFWAPLNAKLALDQEGSGTLVGGLRTEKNLLRFFHDPKP